MSLVWLVLWLLLLAYSFLIWARLVIDIVREINRSWCPRGAGMVACEVTYTLTDPLVRLARRVVPTTRVGGLALDFSYTVAAAVVYLLMALVWAFI